MATENPGWSLARRVLEQNSKISRSAFGTRSYRSLSRRNGFYELLEIFIFFLPLPRPPRSWRRNGPGFTASRRPDWPRLGLRCVETTLKSSVTIYEIAGRASGLRDALPSAHLDGCEYDIARDAWHPELRTTPRKAVRTPMLAVRLLSFLHRLQG